MSDRRNQPIRVEVVYAARDGQVLVALEMEAGATAHQAIERSGILRRFPEIDLVSARVGIFGRVTGLATLLRDGDRVEIYRTLAADPKQTRRERGKPLAGRSGE
jgi:putative ubiquitin-RnfH superfamily antitoxin RatB of RatAB toxin-antitoxin module